jgi:Zn-finger nucleic acid-binding protein
MAEIKDGVWACPKCQKEMSPGTSLLLRNWHCSTCGFDWVSGEALANFLPTVRAFEKLRAQAASEEPSTRLLRCPSRHAGYLRPVKTAGVTVDVCPKCAGIALDPGELSELKANAHRARYTPDANDVITGLDALLQLLTTLK